MQAPEFWGRPPGILSTLLSPLGALYGSVTANRAGKAPSCNPDIPVICIGNIVLGGAGKTPVARSVASHAHAAGFDCHFLSRGYGGRDPGPTLVDPTQHTAADVGDEPLLLARDFPTWVSRNRADGCRAAVESGAKLIIMDDGFQNPAVAKSLSLIVVDAGYGFGNGMVFPAGPLREPVIGAMKRADAVVLVGDGPKPENMDGIPVMQAYLESIDGSRFRGRRIHAFSGIGRPEKFFQSLADCGAVILKRRKFADHHPFTEAEIASIIAAAQADDAVPVTTEKDMTRIPGHWHDRVSVLTVGLRWENNRPLLQMIERLNG